MFQPRTQGYSTRPPGSTSRREPWEGVKNTPAWLPVYLSIVSFNYALTFSALKKSIKVRKFPVKIVSFSWFEIGKLLGSCTEATKGSKMPFIQYQTPHN